VLKLWAGAIAAGIALGIVYTLSPMSVWFLIASAAIVWVGGRDLPPRERRWVRGLLAAAIAVRVLLIAALFLFGTPDHAPFSVFFGDEQYLVFRSWRLRNLWLGSSLTEEAFRDVYDVYGRTSYLNVIAYIQLLIGPAPYGVHLFNTALAAVAAIVLHRLTRRSFGVAAALMAFTGVLFFPSFIVWTASALKESLNFLAVVTIFACVVALMRGPLAWKPVAAIGIAAGLGVLSTLRAGIFEITVAGLAAAFLLRVATYRAWRLAALTVAIPLTIALALRQPAIQARALDRLRPAAHTHLGHVLTRGHAYKVLDERFYRTHDVASMNWSDAKYFVVHALISGVIVPLPWESQSRAELAYIPEQLVWWGMVLTAFWGIASGLRRDALLTSLLVGHAAIVLAVVALHTGNVGTLVRHRAMALPYVMVLSAVGIVSIVGRVVNTHARVENAVEPAART
jgi:hypothetical protein